MKTIVPLLLALTGLLPGQRPPDFTLTATSGEAVSLTALEKKGPVVVAFFPKAFTGG